MTSQTPDQIAARWASNLGGATQKITEGVNAVQVAPGQAAARQKAVWLQNVTASQAKWATRVASVPLADWQKAMSEKGVQRIASGAAGAQNRFAGFMGQLLPHLAAGQRALPPRGNLDQNIARMVAMVRHTSTFSQR